MNLTQADLADLAGVGISSVRGVEAGLDTASLAILRAVLDALGLGLGLGLRAALQAASGVTVLEPVTAPEFSELREVDVAEVYKAGALAGRVHRESDDVLFTYDDAYLGSPDAVPVAVTLPLGASARASAGAVPPFFAGLLPEGVRLQAVTTAARTSVDDHLTLLLVVGADTIEDVQVLPVGTPPTEPRALLDMAGAGVEDFGEVFARATSTDPAEVDLVSLPGVQVKVSAAVMSTPVGTTSGPAILKLAPPGWPRLVENEHFFLSMAAACGLPVRAHQLLHDHHGRAGLLVERFDRVVIPGGVPLRLAQEDACQVLGRYPAAKYRLTFQEVAAGLAGAVHDAGGSRPLALRRALETAAVSYLVGHGDLHGKNLSIRRSPDGLWEVTPAYDLVCTQPYLSWSDPMALPMYGRANRLSRRWWIDAASRLGLPEKALARSLDRMTSAAEPWIDRAGEIGLDDGPTTRLQEMMTRRLAELRG